MEFKFSALFFQKSNSTSGLGSVPDFNAVSGSYFNTFLICLVHVITAPSSTCALSLEEILSEVVVSCGGMGSIVLPFTSPMVT
mmetsp:Transcript_26845/g.4874  ORF Transcript_26845/g.4874 Transcript_26845/m.4874 type:complete len:83 (-) Transcript_26845:476-724(-)